MSKGGKVNITPKISLGVFVPSNFTDKEWLFDILDKKIDEIGLIGTICCGDNLTLEWAKTRNKPCLIYPIKGGYNLLEAFTHIIKAVDKVCIINNGYSESVGKLEQWCKEKEMDYRVLECKTVIEELNKAKLTIEDLEKKLVKLQKKNSE